MLAKLPQNTIYMHKHISAPWRHHRIATDMQFHALTPFNHMFNRYSSCVSKLCILKNLLLENFVEFKISLEYFRISEIFEKNEISLKISLFYGHISKSNGSK